MHAQVGDWIRVAASSRQEWMRVRGYWKPMGFQFTEAWYEVGDEIGIRRVHTSMVEEICAVD
jgi:hypothetical protein